MPLLLGGEKEKRKKLQSVYINLVEPSNPTRVEEEEEEKVGILNSPCLI